ncbi:MAG: translation initiation factor IF-3 [Bacilli bacterium]|nr:translation initiation factor IF-3 [Bacilli bacterium]MDD3121432.1 translation initiation factor IF-3 [Bacilli bacterium]MDD4063291.1 translation initiation factor IF-3 [Bacilli bacterium]MDD4482173.1 translation initiation factor IF-3 [Bacilli bacterium]MDD5182658.1 translation initiation factor IF-3 [Bacilli bacterium]
MPFDKVLVIDEKGDALGVKSTFEAQKMASEKGYDLVCVAPDAKTPVCRFMDYTKYRFELKRKARESRKHQRVVSVKEIWLTPVIGLNDFETKLRKGRSFLENGDKLKVTLRYRSYRMLNNEGPNMEMLDKFIESTKDLASVETQPKLEGRNISMLLVPLKEK